MAVTYFFGERIPSYVCLSTDVVANKVTGINTIGSRVYFTDTGTEWIVKDDLVLVPFAANTIGGTSGSSGSLSGSLVQVSNFPATQVVSGSVAVLSSASAIITGSFVVGNTITNPIILNNKNLVGVTTGSNLTGTSLTFLVSNDNATYLPLYNNASTEVSLTITTAARNYSVDPSTFYPWNFIKGRLGTSSSAIAQATVDSLIYFVTKQV